VKEGKMKNFECQHCGKILAQRLGNSLFVGRLEIPLDRSRPVICDAEDCQKKRLETWFRVERKSFVEK
jgi:hypothetical protein